MQNLQRGNSDLECQAHLVLVEVTASISVESTEGDGDAEEVGVEGASETKDAAQ